MKATIPISDSDPVAEEKSGSSELGRTTSAVTESFSIWAIAGYYSMLSSKKHFRITYPASDLIQGGAEQIAEHLEASYEKIESLGFSWSARTCWPIEVTIQPIIGTDGSPNSRWGEYVPSRWGINHYSLNLNANNMNNQTEINTMKLTSSHELFHILQAMYDARSWWAIATDPGRWYWMDEASAVWFETLMAPNPNEYIASVARDNSQFLFNNPLDFYTGDRLVVADHGYGASSFLKFFTKKHGNSVVAEMYKLHRKSTSYTPINALESVSKYNMIVDWNQFCQDYFEGLLYPQSSLSLAHRLKTASTFNVDRNVYSTNAYYGYLPGLSARLYAVSFAAVKDTIPAKTIAYFTNNYPPANDYALTTTVFRVKGNPEAVNKVGVLKKLGSNELNELLFDLMSPDVKNLAANGENLYVLIVNSDTKPDTIAQCLTTEICVPSDSATAAVYSMNYTSKETVFYHDWAKIDPKVTNTDMKGDPGVTFEPGPFQWTSDYHFKYLVENGFGAKKYLEGELSEDKHTVLWFKMEEQTSTSSLDISRKLEAKNIPLIAKKRFDVGYIPGFIYRIQSTAPEVVHYFVYNHSSIDPIEHSETVWENYKFPDSFIELYLYIPYK